jgi:hypothetical protein
MFLLVSDRRVHLRDPVFQPELFELQAADPHGIDRWSSQLFLDLLLK